MNGRQGVGDGEAEIVVAVRRDDDVGVAAAHVVVDAFHECNEVGRHGISDSVGNVDGGRTGGHRDAAGFDHEVGVRPGCVLW